MFKQFIFILLILALGMATNRVLAKSVEDQYKSFCASCHGKKLTGGMGPSLVDNEWKYASDEKGIAYIISAGLAKGGMPAFGKMLTDADIRALTIFIKEQAYEFQNKAEEREKSDATAVFQGGGHEFTLQSIAEIPGKLWAIDFLAANDFLVTEISGQLWRVNEGAATQIKGTPSVWEKGQGGLLDVQVDPQYEKTGWIYLTLSHAQGDAGMTQVVRGKLKKGHWIEQQVIYQAQQKFYSDKQHHFGSRLLFQDEYIYFSVGDRGEQNKAQGLDNPRGKIHRLTREGKIPNDNPFVGKGGVEQTIWSYGHRNPQGLAFHPLTGDLWEAEHGPRGGDEINLVKKGLNYGWPEVTYGMNYDGTPITEKTEALGMEQPVHYWVPSIAVSDIHFYSGKVFPRWENNLFVASLAEQQLRLLTLRGHQRVAKDEVLFVNLGRIRDVAVNSAGEPFVVVNNEGKGNVYQLVPASVAENK